MDDKRLLDDIDSRIGEQLLQARSKKLTAKERQDVIRSIKLKVEFYRKAVAASAKELKTKEFERQGYVQRVIGDAELTPATGVELFTNPLNTGWNAIRGIHALVDEGRNPLPSLKEFAGSADEVGDDIQENFTEAGTTRAIADWERRNLPFLRSLGDKGLTGHIAGFLGGTPEGFVRIGSAVGKIASNETTNAEKLEGLIDLLSNNPAGGPVIGKAVRSLYKRFGKSAVEDAVSWLERNGIPATKEFIERTLGSIQMPATYPRLAPGGASPYRSVTKSTLNMPSKGLRPSLTSENADSNGPGGYSHFNFISGRSVPYPEVIPHRTRWRVTKELMDRLLPKGKYVLMPAMGVDNAINNVVTLRSGETKIRGQGGSLGEVEYADCYEPRDGYIATAVEGLHVAERLLHGSQVSQGNAVQYLIGTDTVASSHGIRLAEAEFRDAMIRGYSEEDLLEATHAALQRLHNLQKYQSRQPLGYPDSLEEFFSVMKNVPSFDTQRDLFRQLFSGKQSLFPTHRQLRRQITQPELASYRPGALTAFLTLDSGRGPIGRDFLDPELQHFRYSQALPGRNHGLLNGEVDIADLYPTLARAVAVDFIARTGRRPSRPQVISIMRMSLERRKEVYPAKRDQLIRASYDN